MVPLDSQDDLPAEGALLTTRLVTVNVVEDGCFWPIDRAATPAEVGPPWAESRECDCLFAYPDLQALMDHDIRGGFIANGALGEVEMWGSVRDAHAGMTADLARVRSILLPAEWWGFEHQGPVEAARELTAYAVPVAVISERSLPEFATKTVTAPS